MKKTNIIILIMLGMICTSALAFTTTITDNTTYFYNLHANNTLCLQGSCLTSWNNLTNTSINTAITDLQAENVSSRTSISFLNLFFAALNAQVQSYGNVTTALNDLRNANTTTNTTLTNLQTATNNLQIANTTMNNSIINLNLAVNNLQLSNTSAWTAISNLQLFNISSWIAITDLRNANTTINTKITSMKNLSLDDIRNNMGNLSKENSTIARTGNCPTGYIVQNTTNAGVQCVIKIDPITTYYPSSVLTTGGTNTTSNISLLNFYDERSYNISEGGGSNPLDFYINFTGITTNFTQLYLREYYFGSSNHYIQVQFWDYLSSSWESYFEFVGQEGYTIIQIPVLDSPNHISAGISQLRLHHVQTGVSAHLLQVDMAILQNGNSFTASTNLDGYAKYNFYEISFNGSGNFLTLGNITGTYLNATSTMYSNNFCYQNGTCLAPETSHTAFLINNTDMTQRNINMTGNTTYQNGCSLKQNSTDLYFECV